MSDFFHDPNVDDEGDTFVIHSADGLTLELSPSCLTVRDRLDPEAAPLARLPLNLDRIEGVVAGGQVTAHATHSHVLTVVRVEGGLVVRVTTPHLEVMRQRLPLSGRHGAAGTPSAAAAAHPL
ncbi:MAG TPA: hypothetical protein VKB31_06495 [Trueperaceae bacterium]|nr:hypothetical protein [Trueperaceae bacterium]